MPVGPGVDHVEHGSRGLRRHEAQHLLQDRLDAGEAADIVWATNAAEMYQLLVGQRGWSPRRYEHFLADTWRRLLLADR
jgi:hypothetical protein